MEVQGDMGQSWCGSPMDSHMWTETKKCVWNGNGVRTLLRVNPIICQREDRKRYAPNEFIELGGNSEGQRTSTISTTNARNETTRKIGPWKIGGTGENRAWCLAQHFPSQQVGGVCSPAWKLSGNRDGSHVSKRSFDGAQICAKSISERRLRRALLNLSLQESQMGILRGEEGLPGRWFEILWAAYKQRELSMYIDCT